MDSRVEVEETIDGDLSLAGAPVTAVADTGVAGAELSMPVHAEIPSSEDSMVVA
jgi:hypothetical protein